MLLYDELDQGDREASIGVAHPEDKMGPPLEFFTLLGLKIVRPVLSRVMELVVESLLHELLSMLTDRALLLYSPCCLRTESAQSPTGYCSLARPAEVAADFHL